MAARATLTPRTCATAALPTSRSRCAKVGHREEGARRGLQGALQHRGRQVGRRADDPRARRASGRHWENDIKGHMKHRLRARLRARPQHPFRPDRSARRYRRNHGSPKGPRPHRPLRICEGRRRALPYRDPIRTQAARRMTWPLPMPAPSAADVSGIIETNFKEECETDLFGERRCCAAGSPT